MGIPVIINLSKPIKCPRVYANVNYEFWVIMMYQHRFIDWNKYGIWFRMWFLGEAMVQRGHGESLHLPFNFAVNLNCFKKKKWRLLRETKPSHRCPGLRKHGTQWPESRQLQAGLCHLNKHQSKPKRCIQLVAVHNASCKEAKRAEHITRRRRARRLPGGGGLAGVRVRGQRRRQKQSLDPGLSLGWLGFCLRILFSCYPPGLFFFWGLLTNWFLPPPGKLCFGDEPRKISTECKPGSQNMPSEVHRKHSVLREPALKAASPLCFLLWASIFPLMPCLCGLFSFSVILSAVCWNFFCDPPCLLTFISYFQTLSLFVCNFRDVWNLSSSSLTFSSCL